MKHGTKFGCVIKFFSTKMWKDDLGIVWDVSKYAGANVYLGFLHVQSRTM